MPDEVTAEEAIRLFDEAKKRSKYGARRTERYGQMFDSQAEANYYDVLILRKRAGEIVDFSRQPVFNLGEDHKYRADFLVWYPDMSREAVDVKGFETPDFKRHKKMWKKYGTMPLRVVRKGKTTEIVEKRP